MRPKGEGYVVCHALNNVDFFRCNSQYRAVQDGILKRKQEGSRIEFSEAESMVVSGGRDIARQLLQDFITSFGPGDVGPELNTVDGEKLNRKRLRERQVITLLGTIHLERVGYYSKEVNSQFPLDAYLNLSTTSYSHKLRKRVAIETARGSFSEASESIENTNGVKIHKRQIEEIAISSACDFDEFYELKKTTQSKEQNTDLPILAISLDSKGVVMRKEDLTEFTRRAADEKEHVLKHRLTKGEKRNRKRMATAAAVYSIDTFARTPHEIVAELKGEQNSGRKRPKPQFKRVWARLDSTADQVTDELFKEAKARDPNFNKLWVVLVDGDKKQLRRVKKKIKEINPKTIIVLDIIHVIEYLWKASHAFFGDSHQESERWVKEKLLELLKGKAGYSAGGINRSITRRKLKGQKKKEALKSSRYIYNNKKIMGYDKCLALGLPIATGVIEGVCRHVIKDRMDVTGARWSMKGAEAILRLRSLRASGDFDQYWIFHEKKEFERNYGHLKVVFNKRDLI
jgi:hypothetical protein